MMKRPANPKAQHSPSHGRAHWYPYYAGYSPVFVADVLAELQLSDSAVVLDPWNGSGTTTTVCSMAGVRSTGFDINPAMVVVAKARLLADNTSGSLAPLLAHLIGIAKANWSPASEDPLNAWFDRSTSGRLRALVEAIQSLLVEKAAGADVGSLSSLAAFYFVLVFRLVRRSLRGLSTSNPTWMKSSAAPEARVKLSWREICESLQFDLSEIRLLDGRFNDGVRFTSASVGVADSCLLPLGSESVDAVITSPPYCTRIDYAVATRVELAVLNSASDNHHFDLLRRKMLGTTLSNRHLDDLKLGAVAKDVIAKIRSHPSKASATYYYSTYLDYFSKLEESLCHVARVIKSNGTATLVVQDSAYKEIHVDLSCIVGECLKERGFELEAQWDFPVSRTLRQIHTQSRSHKRDWQPTESVLVLRKQ